MDQQIRLPELLLPAGSFDSALAAFEGGADAVYLGFSSFSARAQARNFSLEEYRRLLAYARTRTKKVYVAINTLILDEELTSVAELAAFLGHFTPDAVIVQDWGLVRMMRRDFPGLALHGSTQMAIQSPEAALLARDCGISRVVLPRETGISGMRNFVERTPGMEFEVFVHGAMCYSYSGLCHASGILLGRSGNRGQCAQICRSWFELSASGGSEREPGYWFSCKDLDLSGQIRELARAGLSSLKVEGRMKSPEYCHAVARFYRAALDCLQPDDKIREESIRKTVRRGDSPSRTGESLERPDPPVSMPVLRDEARLTFSRSPTQGYFRFHAGDSLIDHAYPGHRGVPVGTVIASRKSGSTSSVSIRRNAAGAATAASEPEIHPFEIEVELSGILGLRDGVMTFPKPAPAEPERFGVIGLSDARTGRPLKKAHAGDRVVIPSPLQVSPGSELSRISARYLDRKAHAPEEYPPAVISVELELSVRAGILAGRISIPACSGIEGDLMMYDQACDSGESMPFIQARSIGGFSSACKVFSESGNSEFRFMPKLGKSTATGPGLPDGGIPMADLFLPPSRLKAIRTLFYAECEKIIGFMRAQKIRNAMEHVDSECDFTPTVTDMSDFELPPRKLIRFSHDFLPEGMPYATPFTLTTGIPLPLLDGFSWLPLAPLVRDFESYSALIEARIVQESALGQKVILGLSAWHHLPFARRIMHKIRYGEMPFAHGSSGRIEGFFADPVLNIANRAGVREIREIMGTNVRVYPPLEASRDYVPPLFHSSGCVLRHSRTDGNCPDGCSRRWTADYVGKSGRFRAIVEDCITMVFLLP